MNFFDKSCQCDLVTVNGEEKYYGFHDCPYKGYGKPLLGLYLVCCLFSLLMIPTYGFNGKIILVSLFEFCFILSGIFGLKFLLKLSWYISDRVKK